MNDEGAKLPGSAPTSSRRHTVVLSDVHLSQAHPHDPDDPLWMLYRTRAFHPDEDFAALVDHLLRTYGADPIELVFNGDILDFDAPWVKDGGSSFDEFPLTDQGCAEQVRRILADHDPWFRAVARLLNAGHRVLFTSGNHDVELFWPGVRRTIREELRRLCALEAGEGEAKAASEPIEERVRFRAWFHVTEDRIYLEHGSQYDVFNGVRHAMLPVTLDRDHIHPMFGKLAFKRTGSRMGYFNPYYEETFYMGFFGYIGHFFSHYALSGRNIVRPWCLGGLRTVLDIWRHRHRDDRVEEGHRLAHEETGASRAAIDATHALRARPAEETMLPILRELWLDRVGLAFLIVLVAGVATLLAGWSVGAITLGALVVLFVLYELLTPKPDIRTYDSAPLTVLELFDIHDVRAICMGHTHRPFARWDDRGRVYANSGSWCPAFIDPHCTKPVLDRRPLLFFTTEGDALRGGLYWWKDGELIADVDADAGVHADVHADADAHADAGAGGVTGAAAQAEE